MTQDSLTNVGDIWGQCECSWTVSHDTPGWQMWAVTLCQNTGTNEVSGTSEFLLFEPPVRVTGGWQMEFEAKTGKFGMLAHFSKYRHGR